MCQPMTPLPAPMLLRSSPLPPRRGFSFEPKWDGFRALVSTAGDRLVVRSRRRWDMSELVPELAGLPPGRVYDGELIAFGADGLPSFPRLCERMLAGRGEIPVMFVCFDLLAEDGEPLLGLPYRERRRRLEALDLNGPSWCTTWRPTTARAYGTGCATAAWRASSRSGSPSRTGLASAAG